ncbi:MAG: hypothetical protein QW478_06210 [Candidatus Micrarchaeaceae archaeon]
MNTESILLNFFRILYVKHQEDFKELANYFSISDLKLIENPNLLENDIEINEEVKKLIKKIDGHITDSLALEYSIGDAVDVIFCLYFKNLKPTEASTYDIWTKLYFITKKYKEIDEWFDKAIDKVKQIKKIEELEDKLKINLCMSLMGIPLDFRNSIDIENKYKNFKNLLEILKTIGSYITLLLPDKQEEYEQKVKQMSEKYIIRDLETTRQTKLSDMLKNKKSLKKVVGIILLLSAGVIVFIILARSLKH